MIDLGPDIKYFSQTYYVCDGKIFIFDMVRKKFIQIPFHAPANIRMPTTPVHNSGLNMVALGYNSAFFIANIYVSNIKDESFLNTVTVYIMPPTI